jgi:tetratricopeptide (TPR) repeat protein
VNSQISSTDATGSRVSPAASPLRSGVVPPLAEGFAARPESAAGLLEALLPATTIVLTPARTGPVPYPDWRGSCGKTQLAVWIAESLWQARTIDLLIWVTAASRAAILAAYAEATATIGIDSPGNAESAAARLVRWLGQANRHWLVVLDGLSNSSDLLGLWPTGPAGRTLITTHDAGIIGHEGVLSFPVPGLSRREALGYLMGRLTADWEQRAGAVDLVDHLGGEPLALSQAAAVVGSSAISCRDYIELFNRKRDQFAAAGHGAPATAAITWAVSAEMAGTVAPGGPAQAMLTLAAVVDGRRIPGTYFVTPSARTYGGRGAEGGQASPEATWAGVVSLEQAGLVSIDPAVTPPVVRMSQAVQAAMLSVAPRDALGRAVMTAANSLLEAWPDDDQDAWLADSMRSCSASVIRLAGDMLWSGGYRLLFRVGQSLDNARLAGLAVTHWSELADDASRKLGPAHPDALLASDKLADALLAAGRATEATGWLARVLADRAVQLGPEHPATIASEVSLGRAMLAAGQPEEAIPVLDRAISHREQAFGADDVTTLDVLAVLADACQSAQRTPDAIRLYQRVFAGRERAQGANNPATIDAGEKLGDAYLIADRVKDAQSIYKRVVGRREKTQGSDHRDTILARGKLAAAYQKAGKMVIALQVYEQCRADSVRVLGADHPDTLGRAVSLAHVYYSVGRIGDAAALLRETIERCDRVLMPDDPLRQTAKESLANIAGELPSACGKVEGQMPSTVINHPARHRRRFAAPGRMANSQALSHAQISQPYRLTPALTGSAWPRSPP